MNPWTHPNPPKSTKNSSFFQNDELNDFCISFIWNYVRVVERERWGPIKSLKQLPLNHIQCPFSLASAIPTKNLPLLKWTQKCFQTQQFKKVTFFLSYIQQMKNWSLFPSHQTPKKKNKKQKTKQKQNKTKNCVQILLAIETE